MGAGAGAGLRDEAFDDVKTVQPGTTIQNEQEKRRHFSTRLIVSVSMEATEKGQDRLYVVQTSYAQAQSTTLLKSTFPPNTTPDFWWVFFSRQNSCQRLPLS